jgi:transcription elongation GreA/GreB family factor
VTPKGLAQIDAELTTARAAYAAAQADAGISADRTAMARATRDLRYWSARRASAQLIETRPTDGSIAFGHTVTFEREDGRTQSYAIVGDDEADPANGSVSYVSPLARAMIGKTIGDVVTLAGQEVEITAIA